MLATGKKTIPADVQKFFTVLFPSLEGGFVEQRVFHPTEKEVYQYFYDSIDQLLFQFPEIDRLAKNFNVYFGVCPRSRKEGTKSAVQYVLCLWVDLDFKLFKGGKDEALARLRDFPLSPTIIINSGYGFHVYWRFREPEQISEPGDVAKIESYLKALANALNADPKSAELARVLRIPGTLNHRDPINPLPVQIVQINSELAYNLSDFDAYLNIETSEDIPKAKAIDWIADDLANLSEGNRNSTFASIVGRLHHDGLPASAILALLEPHAEKCQFPQEELKREVEGICNRYATLEVNSHFSLISQATLEKKWPDPLREEAFYGLVGDIVRKIAPHTESDPAALVVQTMVVFGNVIGRTAHFVAEADRHYLNIFSVVVGPTSKGRKGTSFGHIKRLFKGVDATWLTDRIPSGLSSGEGLIWAVRDKIEKKDPIKKKGLVTGYQNIEVDPGISDKRLLVMESEFASPLRIIGREGNTLSALIRQAWDTGMLETLTKNSPAKSTNAHISIIGHITKDELRRYLDKTEYANGFGNRFLWACTKRSKLLPEGGHLHEEDLAPIVRRLSEAIHFAKTVTEIKRDESARAFWLELYPNLSKEVPGLLGAMTARSEAQVMRLACIYALFDCSNIIRLEHLRAALSLWDYCDASVRYIFGDNLGDPIADTILSAIRSSPAGLSRTDISNLFGRHVLHGQIPRALGLLKELGLVDRKDETTLGRPREIWFAVAK